MDYSGCIGKTDGTWDCCTNECGCEYFVVLEKLKETDGKANAYYCKCLCGAETRNIYLPWSNTVIFERSLKSFILGVYASYSE